MISLILVVVLLSAISAAFAFAVTRLMPQMRASLRGAIAGAATAAALLAASVSAGLLLPEPLLLLAAFVGVFAVPCFPVALIVARGVERDETLPPKRPGDTFE